MTPNQLAQTALVDMGIVVSGGTVGVAETIDFPDEADQAILVDARPYLETFTRIGRLDLSDTMVIDVTPLKGLVNLQQLDLFDTPVHDITLLQDLNGLHGLDCARGAR